MNDKLDQLNMVDKEPSLHLQFGPWLMSQISSGDYPGLEWLDGEEKTIFKIPWTKVNYPMWEEHHRIFQAWAVHRGKYSSDTGEMDQSFSQIKSNFRTILRKCVEIEEMEDSHQLGLQMGNYKVYRILTKEESDEKRRSQQKTRKAYKWIRHEEGTLATGPHKYVLDKNGRRIATRVIYREKVLQQMSPKPAKRKRVDIDISASQVQQNTRTQSTQTCPDDFPKNDVAFILEPAAFEEAVGTDTDIHEDDSKSLHHSVSTQFELQSHSSDIVLKEHLVMAKPVKRVSSKLDGFQMLLEAAELANDTNDAPTQSYSTKEIEDTTNIEMISLNPVPPSIVDVLVELKIPPDELFTYEMHVRYETRHVMNNVCLNDMRYGYRLHYSNHNVEKTSIEYCKPERADLIADFDRTSITFPESKVPPGNSLYTVLKNIDAGLIIKSDNQYTLCAKRLCMSRVYAFTTYGDEDADIEPMLMPREKEVILFSYKKFLKDWHQFLIEGSPKPNHEINLAFGKKPKHRHSRVFVAVTLVPKAAETMLKRIASIVDKADGPDMEEAMLDNVLRLFNGDIM